MMNNILLFATISLFLSMTTMAQKIGDIKIEPYTFVKNNGQKIEAEFGRIYVPERHAKPTRKLIELSFVRFKSTARIPSFPIVYLTGGPGGSGISLAKGARFPLFMAMCEFGDVIALDQRGAGLSKPNLTCKENLDYPLDKATEKAKALRLYDEQLKLVNDLAKKDKQLRENIPDFIELVQKVFAKLEKEPAKIEVLDTHTKQNVKIKLGKFDIQELTIALLGDSPDFPFPDVCSAWGNLDLGENFRQPVKSNVPVLFISGTFDARTPPRNAVKAQKGFPNSFHVLIVGAGHGDELFVSSPKIKDVMLEFMRDVPLSMRQITLAPFEFKPLVARQD